MRIEVDGILFDSDGVLVDSEADVIDAWSQLAHEFDLDFGTLAAELAGVRAADTLGRHLDGRRLDDAVRRLEELEIALAEDGLAVPGARDLCASLPDGSWAIATSAVRRLAVARWAGAGIPVPSVTITADDVGHGKPHPEPYLSAASALGLDPSRCLVFEDSPSGGESARAAGAVVVAVGSVPWSFEPAARVADLRSVSVAGEPGRLVVTIESPPGSAAASTTRSGDDLTRHYDRTDSIVDGVLTTLADAGHDVERLDPSALAGVDEFHLGGRRATETVIESLRDDPPATVLDIGCGIGGPARTMATAFGANVVGVDLTPAFVAAATDLTARTGLGDRATFVVGDALAIDLDDETFDVVTMFHVGMNIADKDTLFSEIFRVLRPGGRALVYDIMRIAPGELDLPLPWTTTADHQHLADVDEYLAAMRGAGLAPSAPIDRRPVVAEALRSAADAPPPVTLAHLMGLDFGLMFTNLRRALDDGLVAPTEIVASKAVAAVAP